MCAFSALITMIIAQRKDVESKTSKNCQFRKNIPDSKAEGLKKHRQLCRTKSTLSRKPGKPLQSHAQPHSHAPAAYGFASKNTIILTLNNGHSTPCDLYPSSISPVWESSGTPHISS